MERNVQKMEYTSGNMKTPKYIVLEFSILFTTMNIFIRSNQDKFHRIKIIMQLKPGIQRYFKVNSKQCGLEQSQTVG